MLDGDDDDDDAVDDGDGDEDDDGDNFVHDAVVNTRTNFEWYAMIALGWVKAMLLHAGHVVAAAFCGTKKSRKSSDL